MDKFRIAIVTPSPVWRNDNPFSGFGYRNARLFEEFSRRSDTLQVIVPDFGLFAAGDGDSLTEDVRAALPAAPREVRSMVVPTDVGSGQGRTVSRAIRGLRDLTGFAPLQTWERALRDALDACAPDVVVTFAYPHWFLLRSAYTDTASIAIIEEDFGQRKEYLPTTTLGRLRRHLGDIANRKPELQPTVSVVISEAERDWANRLYPNARCIRIDHTIDEDYWCAPNIPPMPGLGRFPVFVVGDFGARRNAGGLQQVLEELRNRDWSVGPPHIYIASSREPHPELHLDPSLLTWLGKVDDLRPYYRAACCALVPSFEPGGAKTTVLQGWASGCPVVATKAAARSVAAECGVDLFEGTSPADVADALERLLPDEALQRRLAESGRRRFHAEHGKQSTRLGAERAIALAHGH